MRATRDGRIGVTLGARWRLDRKIGSGGVASVYAGTDLRTRRAVAVKVLHDDLAGDEEVRRRFLREGVVVNRIEHPGVVRVDDAGTDGDRTYLVMDLLTGQTLKEAWQAAGEMLPEAEVALHLARVLEIVIAAHAAGVVHRDLKADNIFLTETGELKLLDFGIARLRDPNKVDENATAAGSMLGTPACMPPEQALGKWDEVDERADVFAMGATAFRMLTGKQIHEARSLPELLMAVASKPARPIRSVSQAVAPALASVIDRALAFDKTARWSSAGEMLRALREAHPRAADLAPLPLSEASTTERTVPAPRSSTTNEWAQPASIEPTTDRMEDADDSVDSGAPTGVRESPLHPVAKLVSGPTVLSPRAATVLMPQNLTLASPNVAAASSAVELDTNRLGSDVVGQVLENIGQTKRSKAQSATAALVAATSAPRRAGTIPMPPQVDAKGGAAGAVGSDLSRTVEMPPRAPATELLEAHVARHASAPPAAPATVLLEAPLPPRASLPAATPMAPASSAAPVALPKSSGGARWLLLVLVIAIGAVAGWLLFRSRAG